MIAIGAGVCVQCGFNVNHFDIAPNHASTLMGITNGISHICAIIAPLAVQFIVTNEVG